MERYQEILSKSDRPKIGVVISSGALKAAAAIELFAFFETANIPVDLLSGCSGGGIVSTLKAKGLSADEMRDTIKKVVTPEVFRVNYRTLAVLANIPFLSFKKDQALFRNDILLDLMAKICGKETNIQDLAIPLILQATDVDSGISVSISQGSLYKSLYASSALIPFFPPINIEGRWLADGGYSSSLPLLPAVTGGMDIIIVVNVQPISSYIKKNDDPKMGLKEYFENFYFKTLGNSTSFQNALAVDLHHHEIIFVEIPFPEGVAMWEPQKLPMVFEKGKKAVEGVKAQIIAAIESFKPGSRGDSRA